MRSVPMELKFIVFTLSHFQSVDVPCSPAIRTKGIATGRTRPQPLPATPTLHLHRHLYRMLAETHRAVNDGWVCNVEADVSTKTPDPRMYTSFIPFSSSFFSFSHFHLVTSSELITLATSSSGAFTPCFTHSGSGQPTRSTSPSDMQSPQKSTRQALQNTCPHTNEMHLAPLIELKHTPQA